jgi:oxygen-independent coproporphyrinogen-3 oxidase
LGEGKEQKSDELYYHELIIKEIYLWILKYPSLKNKRITSIFFGGGTPSRMKEDSLDQILRCIEKEFNLAEKCEITIESNPEDLSLEKIKKWQTLGINRLSIGIQSLKKNHLNTLDRYIDEEKYENILRTIAHSEIKNISADLIYGIPGQTKDEFFEDVISLVNSGLNHISMYSLTREKGTKYHRDSENDQNLMPNEAIQEEVFQELPLFMHKLGFHWYEVSNYSKENMECRHNLSYWMMNSFLGLGAGAHGFIENTRTTHPKNLIQYKKYISENMLKCGFENHEFFTEFALNSLRLLYPIDLRTAQQNFTDRDYSILLKSFETWNNLGYCFWDGSIFQWKKEGIILLDSLVSDLYSKVKSD